MSDEPTLEKGISSEWVAYLQGLMQVDGFWQGDTNGTFDDDLEQAVQTLQDDLGLPRTGVVDADTWFALQQRTQSTQQPAQAAVQQEQVQSGNLAEAVGNPTLRKGTSSEWVQYLQAVMQHVGYWNGATDGVFTDELEQAVRTLQGRSGLPRSGVVDADTWSLLDTLSHQPTTAQEGRHTGRPVSELSATEKLVEAFNRAEITAAIRERILATLSPEALAAAILTFAAVSVAAQFTPIGWAEDIAFGVTAIFMGTALLRAVHHLIQFAGAATATTDEELTDAGNAFAQACAELEIDTLLFLITRASGGAGGGPSVNVPSSADMVLASRNGQLVVVAVDSIPVRLAGQWGITGARAASAMAMTGSDEAGGSEPPSGGGGRPTGGGRGEPTDGGGGKAQAPAGPSLLQLAQKAGVAQDIEGEVEVFAHGTSSKVAREMIESSGDSLSANSGNFGGEFHTVPNASVARVFAQRTASKIAGEQPAVVGVALPRRVADMLRQRGLLRVDPIQNPPPGVGAGTQQWVFKPGAFPYLKQYGSFFPIQ